MGEDQASGTRIEKPIGVVRESRRRSTAATSSTGPTHPGHFLTVFGLVALVLLSGGKFLWVQGAFVAIIGLLLIFRPPRNTLDTKLDWTIAILMGIGLIAFLPSGLLNFLPKLFFGRPTWWENLDNAGVALPITLATQPLKSLEGYIMLFAGVAYLYLLLDSRVRMSDRWRLLQLLVILGGILAAVVVYGNATDAQYFWTDRAASFSYFDNRNQTSILLVMIGILALAMTFYAAHKSWWWMPLCALAFIACMMAISMSLSRAGLLLFVLGTGIWIILRFTLLGDRGIMSWVAPLIAVSFSLMLITGQQTLGRFNEWLGSDGNMFSDFRWSIYRDTLSMIGAQPATGVGLGNFSVVFPHFRAESISAQPIIHPESDWMWVAAELGAPGLSILATLVCFLYWMCFPFNKDHLAPVRTAALIAASIFLVHTFFDVSGHQLGVVLLAIWIFRMGMPHLKNDIKCRFPPWLWRMGGVFLLSAGGVWIAADMTNTMLHSSLVKEKVISRVSSAMETRETDGLTEDIETALTFLPLDWELYLQRGQARLYLQSDTNGAREDFLRARAIEPVLVAPAFFEGQVWLPRSTHYAYEAWADAINRHSENPAMLHHRIILAARQNPRFGSELDQLSQSSSEFRSQYLSMLGGEKFLEAITDDLRRDPKLKNFTEDQRETILRRWMEEGDVGRLIKYLDANPEAAANSWYYQAAATARMGNYPAALELAKQHAPVPQIPVMESMTMRDVSEQRAMFAARPTDLVRGGALLQTQINQNDVEGALWTIERLLELEKPPPYAYYWKGELNRMQNKHKDAWAAWKVYLAEVVERKMELKTAQAEMFEGIEPIDEDQPVIWRAINEF